MRQCNERTSVLSLPILESEVSILTALIVTTVTNSDNVQQGYRLFDIYICVPSFSRVVQKFTLVCPIRSSVGPVTCISLDDHWRSSVASRGLLNTAQENKSSCNQQART